MGIELITGMGGTNHVDSEDVGALNAELIGNGNYLLSGCEVTMTDANTCHVAAGELLLQGRHVRIKGAGEDVSIGNGQAGYNQRYLICLAYNKATSGIETVELQAFAGAKTTGTATDPAVAVGSILGGDTNVVVPLARLELTGLSVGTPAVMLDSVKGLVALGAETKKLGDSVSQINQYPGGMSGNVIDQSWHVLPLGGNRVALVFEASPWYTVLAKKEYYYEAALPIEVKKVLFSCAESTQWRCDRTRVTFNEGDTTVMKIAANIDRDASGGTAAEPFYITIKAMIIAEI